MAQNVMYAWEQRPDYREACRTQPGYGDPQSYTPPRRPGVDPGDVTDFQVGQATWNVNNLPEILYQLEPDHDWELFKSKPVQYKRNPAGNIMLEQWPAPNTTRRPLKDFAVLANINQICTQEHPLIIEAWRRLDPRIAWSDIMMRMQWHSRPKQNTLNENTGRTWRKEFSLFSWHGTEPIRTRPTNIAVLGRLSPAHLANNTTRGITPGLVNPNLPGGGSVPLPDLTPNQGFQRRKAAPPGHIGLTRTIQLAQAQQIALPPTSSGGNLQQASDTDESSDVTDDRPGTSSEGSARPGPTLPGRNPRNPKGPRTPTKPPKTTGPDDTYPGRNPPPKTPVRPPPTNPPMVGGPRRSRPATAGPTHEGFIYDTATFAPRNQGRDPFTLAEPGTPSTPGSQRGRRAASDDRERSRSRSTGESPRSRRS